MRNMLDAAAGLASSVSGLVFTGSVIAAAGRTLTVTGLEGHAGLGDRVAVDVRGIDVAAEIVAFERSHARVLMFGDVGGVSAGATVRLERPLRAVGRASLGPGLRVGPGWLGRVVDPLGRPLDGRGVLSDGDRRPSRGSPPDAAARGRLGSGLTLGVRALDLFCPMRSGQRLGLFAGSGVGKSTLLAMLARGGAADVAVVALVGERGREVREFIEDELGADGLARSVVVVATSDQAPLLRREAAYAATTVAEAFRDMGRSVLLVMDSVTRFCLACREIGLAAGEAPATRGYPPSVFAELPALLERAGPGRAGPDGTATSITALYTVLVEGDDHNEPVADAVRGILDGHVVMDRRIAERGRYPAVDVLRSLSRAARGCLSDGDAARVAHARSVLARWSEMEDMVRLGAYRSGSDPSVEEAIRLAPRLEAMLRQDRSESSTASEAIEALAFALDDPRAA